MKNKRTNNIAAVFLLSISLSFSAGLPFEEAAFVAAANEYHPSSWASQKISVSEAAGLISEDFAGQPYNKNISRIDFCEILINSCEILDISMPELLDEHPFLDTKDSAAEYAYLLGLVQGTTENTFSPDETLTREMAAVMLSRLQMLYFNNAYGSNSRWVASDKNHYNDGSTYNSAALDNESALKILKEYSSDSHLVSSWAASSLADVYTKGILSGTGKGKLDPKNNITREQAAILSLNLIAYCNNDKLKSAGVEECVLPMPSGIYIEDAYFLGDVYLRWSAVPDAWAYDVSIFYGTTEIFSTRTYDSFLDLRTGENSLYNSNNIPDNENSSNDIYSILGNKNKTTHAILKVTPVDSDEESSLFSLSKDFTILPWINENDMLLGDPSKSYFANNAEALSFMTTVKVNIWKLTSSGTKKSSTINLTVNKNVAEDIKKIFAEIYNGKEKFPIKSCGGYAFRNGMSEHSRGTAIDINPDENYFVTWEGVPKVGSFWKPGENPYSIPPDGDVVRAFNKYGWHWSPDMRWPNGADYMHFSFSGR